MYNCHYSDFTQNLHMFKHWIGTTLSIKTVMLIHVQSKKTKLTVFVDENVTDVQSRIVALVIQKGIWDGDIILALLGACSPAVCKLDYVFRLWVRYFVRKYSHEAPIAISDYDI